VDRADPGARPALDGTREGRILGGRGRTDRDHGDGFRIGWPGRTFAERLEPARLAGIPGTYGVTASVEHSGRRPDDQPIGSHHADCGGAHSVSFGGAKLIRSSTQRETDDEAHANTKTHANTRANGNALADSTAKSLPLMHEQDTMVQELLRQQQSPAVHHVLRRQQQHGVHFALLRQ
jgi:hypothetical protein